ncbi:MAG: biotin/lipoyl-containing protein, partial [Paraburkholderia sp.]|uniref:biotin/lipoyl-containing protein n=1 Tax=Paraburkholderia sp. TaxID=1926495 RepID=UPI003C573DED
MSQTIEVKVPDIGDYTDIPVIEVLVKAGDTVEKEQSLVTLESDKATMDVPSSAAGVVKELKVKVGDTVSEGSVIVVLEADGGAAAPAPAPAPASKQEVEKPSDAPVAPSPAPVAPSALAQAPVIPAGEGGARQASHASPSVRKFARELGVDVGQVQGTGPKGRITQADVTAFIKGVMTGQRAAPAGAAPAAAGGGELNLLPWPKVDFTKFGPIDPKPLSRIKKISGANLHRNWVMI